MSTLQPKRDLSIAAVALRRRAEERLKAQHPEKGATRTATDTQRLVHELQVHQIELEMQNEELQRTMAQVEAEMEKYCDLYDFAPVGYLTLDRGGSIAEVNLACATLLGIGRSQLVKRRFGRFVAAGDRPVFNGFLNHVFENQVRESCELSLLPEGKPPIAVRLEAAVVASGRECRAVVQDITERKLAEADRLILGKLESAGILAAGIAHDFNNLLTVILLNLELSEMLPPGKRLAEHLEEAKKATFLARTLTRRIITFAKGGAPVLKPAFLPAVLRESVQIGLSGSGVRCEFDLADGLWPAEVDEGQLGQVIRNLVLNAREAMPEGGTLTVRAENVMLGAEALPTLPAGEYVRVSIADQGHGIPQADLPKVFDPYFSTKQRGEQKGMGLGLTICHSIIQKHGGAISVESTEGAGATFQIHLPASRQSIISGKAAVPQGAPRPGRILVMDDEEGVRTVLAEALRRLDHEVEVAEHGAQAVDVFQSAKSRGRPFDAVILDLTVRGGMGGQEAIQALRRVDPAVKAILISGYANDPVVLEYGRYGFQGALAKPLELEKLRETLSLVMRNGRGSQDTQAAHRG